MRSGYGSNMFSFCEPNANDHNVIYCNKSTGPDNQTVTLVNHDEGQFFIKHERLNRFFGARGSCKADSCVTFDQTTQFFGISASKPLGYHSYFIIDDSVEELLDSVLE